MNSGKDRGDKALHLLSFVLVRSEDGLSQEAL